MNLSEMSNNNNNNDNNTLTYTTTTASTINSSSATTTPIDDNSYIITSKLNASAGIIHLTEKNFKQAAMKFLLVDSRLRNHYNYIISFEDIYFYIIILSLITFNRKEIFKNLIDNHIFMSSYLSSSSSSSLPASSEVSLPSTESSSALANDLKQLLFGFYYNNYNTTLKLINTFKLRLLTDYYLYNYTNQILQSLQDKLLLQYINSYHVINLIKMSEIFNITYVELEKLLIHLILNNKLKARIDKNNFFLYKNLDQKSKIAIDKACHVTKIFSRMIPYDLIRLSLIKHEFVLEEIDDDDDVDDKNYDQDDDDQYENDNSYGLTINNNNNNNVADVKKYQQINQAEDNEIVRKNDYVENNINDNNDDSVADIDDDNNPQVVKIMNKVFFDLSTDDDLARIINILGSNDEHGNDDNDNYLFHCNDIMVDYDSSSSSSSSKISTNINL